MDPTTAPSPTVRDLFDALVDLPPDARTDRLATLAPDVRAALEALFVADATPPRLLDVPAANAAQQWFDDAQWIAQCIGTRVGPYRITSVLGQGGSSVVFRAERVDGDAAPAVALKLLRGGLFAPDAQRRFAREQAILAQLAHPNIARLIEGGIGDGGVPYIALELIDGATITQHAADAGLSLDARLALVVTLCRAVEAAHAALVVHRDLKPGNVLVDASGAVKVLDFGVARLIDDDAPATRTHAIALTPAYAAPEQFRAGTPTTAIDVYALGVILAELVTGRVPDTRAAQRASSLVDRAVAPPRGLPPPDALARALRGDLDAIIATAAAEEPARRYRSAGALADDLERHRAGMPVRAHPASRWYRAGKFARRHRVALGAGGVAAIALVVAAAVSWWQAGIARDATIAAQAQAARGDAMRDFMFDAFADAEPSTPGGGATVVDAAERAVANVLADHGGDPRAQVELLQRLAEVLGAQGRRERAGELIAVAQERARAIGADEALQRTLEQAAIENLSTRGLYAQARTRLDALLAILPRDAITARIDALDHSAWLAGRESDLSRGLRDGEAALALARTTGDPADLQAASRGYIAMLLASGRPREAIPLYEALLARQRARFGDTHVKVAAEHAGLSRAYRAAGDLPQALVHASAAVAINDAVYPGDHWQKALHLNALAMVLHDLRRFDEAVAVQAAGVRIERATNAIAGNETLAIQTGMLGVLQAHLGRYDDAIATQRDALAMLPPGGETSVLGLRLRQNLGSALSLGGRRADGDAVIAATIADGEALATRPEAVLALLREVHLRSAIDAGDARLARERFAAYEAQASRAPAGAVTSLRLAVLRADVALLSGDLARAQSTLVASTADARAAVTTTGAERPLPVQHALLTAIVSQRLDEPSRETATTAARDAYAALPFPPAPARRLLAMLDAETKSAARE